jgi:hypothetical protein
VTYTETQLIIAETALRTGNTALAQASLNNVRNNETYGADEGGDFSNCTPICTFAAQPVVPATLENIVEEEWIDLIGVPEVYNTYKRTCLPSIAGAPASPSSSVTREVAWRLPYSQNSINSDPNTPNVGSTDRNANQPTDNCPALNYSSVPVAW